MLLTRLLCLFVFLSLILPFPGLAAEDNGKLLKIVALSRHGVRAPTQHKKELELWSQKVWPAWPVKRGDLTPRGADLITGMWANMRSTLQNEGLLNLEQCPASSQIYVRADVDERTKATARALLEGLAPNCGLGFAVSSDHVDPLFHPAKAGLYKFEPIPVVRDVLSMTHGGLADLQDDYSGALGLLGQITGAPDPALCTHFSQQPDCELQDIPSSISVAADGKEVSIQGSLGIASSIAEIFLLEYGEWPGVAAGWGQVNSTILSQLLPIHARVFDVVNRAPVVAWANGSSLLNDMTLALFNRHYDQRCNEAKFVAYVGHDTNLANIGQLLKINWRANGYPFNGIPPGGVLFLELWEKNGVQHVLARFYAQPPTALHSPADGASPALAPQPARVTAPPVVGEARFAVNEFIDRVENAIAGAPLAPEQSPPFEYGPVEPKP